MASAQDYQQWFNAQWVLVRPSVKEVTDSLDYLPVCLAEYKGSEFGVAVSEQNPDGIQKQTDEACTVMAVAQNKLEQLHTNAQREVSSRNANEIIDNMIKSRNQLFTNLDRLRLELIPTARSRYYSILDQLRGRVAEDALEDHGVISFGDETNWFVSLEEANKAIKDSVEKADAAAQAITRIPDEDVKPSKAAVPAAASAMTEHPINRKEVDRWNETALKTMKEGTETAFYEIGDLVIIDAKQHDEQPYLDWARMRDGVNLSAKITMTRKGGAFDSGKITAAGVVDQSNFEKVIKRVSNKKVAFE